MQEITQYGNRKIKIPDGALINSSKPLAPVTLVTRLGFRQRFTFSERVAIETAAQSDASVRVMLKDQEAATFIDLARQDTVDGVNALAEAGLITAERAVEILTAPVQILEQYRG